MKPLLQATWLFATCAAFATFRAPTYLAGASVPSGVWGGDHVVMEVTGAGATVEFDCAHGTIDESLTLDSAGRFDVVGSFTRESGGPVRKDKTRVSPARYTGSLKDSTLAVTVALAESEEKIGVFTLKHGVRARLFKCK